MRSEEKLERLLRYVSENNEFYKNRIKEYGIKNPLDITEWPVLTRKELQENRYNMFSTGYKSKYFNQMLHRQSSSGSTGIPVNVYWDFRDLNASNMSLWRKRLHWYGISPIDKRVMFTLSAIDVPQNHGKVYYYEVSSNVLSFNTSLVNEEYSEMISIIEQFKPKWLYIQPFVLDKLIRAYVQTNSYPPHSIRYVESVGEVLTPDLREKASKLFGVPIVNMYGSEEMNGIAIENAQYKMKILCDNVLIEVKNGDDIKPNGAGEALITNLNNYAMPLIRYCQGDDIVLNSDSGEVEIISGRCIESSCLNGKRLSTLLLCDIISDINNQYKDQIIEYSFKYRKNANQLCVFIKLENMALSRVIVSELDEKILSYFSSIEGEKLSLSIKVCQEVPKIKNHILVVGD